MKKLSLRLVSLFFLFVASYAQAAVITDYHQIFVPGYDAHNNLRIVIRSYYKDSKLYFLEVNPNTFKTKTIPASDFKPRQTLDNVPGYFTMAAIQKTPYGRALWQYTAPPYKLENYGVIHAEQPVDGVYLTIDMCPSVKNFEANFFATLVQLSNQLHQPIPIALSITGLWIIGHAEEFKWLTKQQQLNKLNITWINHSFSHIYYADLTDKDNFLLNEQTNLPQEILATEKILLEKGRLPSVFFRAPGLVTNKNLILILRQFGLIPIGSDAWLAHGQQPRQGSIILVHGNSNEHQGIQLIMPMLQQHAFKLLPLTQLFLR
jgi:hypothetical protein